jgi:predicted small lipoprotein YifL
MQCERSYLRLALIGVVAASLALSACGRKGPLDPPPGASLTGDKAAPADSKSASTHLRTGSRGQPIAPRGPNKRIPLDALLN